MLVEGGCMAYEAPEIRRLGTVAELTEWGWWWFNDKNDHHNHTNGSPVEREYENSG